MADEKAVDKKIEFTLDKAFESEARRIFAYAKKDEIACGLIRATNMESSYTNWLQSYLREKIHGDAKQLAKRMDQKQDLEYVKLIKLGVPPAEAEKRAYVMHATTIPSEVKSEGKQ